MSDPRTTSLILMSLSIAAFVGTTSQALPSATFFPALMLFGIGAFKFMRANREAVAKAEERVERRLNPVISQNMHSHAHAERLAARRGEALNSATALANEDAERDARAASGEMESLPGQTAIELDQQASDFVVGADVSFPVELQTGNALADQLRKLNQLMVQGVLTEEEYAVAKAKLLD